MIKSYTDHAANERTFLAWLRTGVAVIAFGFLIDRFDLFLITISHAVSLPPARHAEIEAMSGTLGSGAGLAFILVGLVFIVVASIRFVRTGYRIDDPVTHPAGIAFELSLSVILGLLLVVASAPLILPLL